VHIRGSASDEWIMLYDWSANKGADNEWVTVNAYSLADSLSANDQDFSSTFQIRFGEREYSTDAFYLDDVKVYERPVHDLAAVDLEVPASSALLGATEQITVQYVNQGVSTETSVPLTVWIDGPSGRQEVRETSTTSLATGDTLTYTFTADMDFSEAGNYEVTVFSELSGDLVQSNDTLRGYLIKPSIYNGGLPYLADFDLLADTVYAQNQGELIGLPGWSYENSSEYGRLSIGQFSQNETQAMSMYRSESNTTSNFAVLTMDMSTYDASTDKLLLDFRFSYRYSGVYAHNRVFIRGSETDDWIEFYDWHENRGGNNEWVDVNTLPLTDSLVAHDQNFSSTFQVRFGERDTYNSRYFYLDDVKVRERPAHDLAAVDLEIPASSPLFGATEQIAVQYVNQGVSTETSVPLTVWIDGPSGRQEVSETAATSLATGDTLTYTFSADMDFSEVGNYEVTVFSELTGDLIQSNDTLRSMTRKISSYTDGLPYLVDFNNVSDTVYTGEQAALVDLEGWSYSSNADNGRLTLGASTNSSGVAMALGRSSSYGNATNHAILTIDMNEYSAVDDDILIDFRFSQRYESSYTEDRAHIRGSASDEWIMFYDWSANKGADNEWITVNAYSLADSLSANDQDFSSTFQIRFGEREYSSDAFYLDDVKVYERPAHDLAALDLEIPVSSPLLGATEQITVQYVNQGVSTETSVPLTVWIDGPSGRQEVSETAATSLATGDTLTYTFSADMDFSEVGNYEVTVFSELTGDLIQSNDTLRSMTRKISSYTDGLPYLVDFNNLPDTVYTGYQGALVDLEGWSYSSNADNGRLTLGASTNSSGVAMALGRSSSYGNATNHAILTIDMNEYSAVD
ncbi:hypothetical protein, partial [Reichenbachiella sp. MSK19-1]|uniref:hypothetical protein n=1 Tax=Reichenbachiella sp. MSK19-1 TaxID=1897631 RepID=UPI0013148EA2